MAEATQRVTVSDHKDVKVVDFVENKILDEANIQEIGQQIMALIDARDRPKLLLDFSKVDHLSSAALGMLLNIREKIMKQSGQLRLCHIKPQIMVVFEITRLNTRFIIHPTRAESLASFS